MFLFSKKSEMVSPEDALPGRPTPLPLTDRHAVLGTPLRGPYPAGIEVAQFGLGCFWGAERRFWELGDGVFTTAVGYAGGFTPNPTYEETCTNKTGHAEVVLVAFDPARITYADLLKVFWESHDPTQGMRQGNDVGTTYRSTIYATSPQQLEAATASRDAYEAALVAAGHRDPITTEIAAAGPFYFAEDHHQQYLHKVPNGYCNLAGTGVSCPVGLGTPAA